MTSQRGPDCCAPRPQTRNKKGYVMAQLFQVLSLMAVPAVILTGIRYLIIRQDRAAVEPSRAASGHTRR